MWNEDEDVPRYKGLYAAAVMRHVAIITVATCSRSLDAATQYSDTRGTCSVHGANVMFVVEGPLMNGRTGEYSSITVTQCSPTTAETWSPSVANGLRLSASL